MRVGVLEFSPGFLLLAAWLNYMDKEKILRCVLMSCFLHELGHLAVLRMLKIPVKRIRITVIGAEIQVGRGMSYLGELWAALAGPGVNLLLSALLGQAPGHERAAGINLILALFNLLPIGRLDGGRALHSGLCLAFGAEKGEILSGLCSAFCVAFSAVSGIWLAVVGGNITLAIISAWFFVLMGDDGIKGRGKIRIGLANLKRKR